MEQAKKAKGDISKQFKNADAKKKEELKEKANELTAKISELENAAKAAIAETAKKLNLIGNIVSDKVVISNPENDPSPTAATDIGETWKIQNYT